MAKINSKSRFLIVGSGGIGGYYGALLAEKGYNVTFLARGDHFKNMANNGLQVLSVENDFIINPVQVVDNLINIGEFDVILFCVKTYNIDELAPKLSNVINEHSIIISIQNGVENDLSIKKHLRNANVFPGFAHIVSSKSAPGKIEQTGGPRTVVFGSRENDQVNALSDLSVLMQDAGINACASLKIEEEMWEKFIFIVAFSGFTALGRCTIGKILDDKLTYELYKRSVRESITVANACGIGLSDNIFEKVMERTEKYRYSGENSTSSLSRDLMAGRKTEIDTLCGAIVRLGESHKIDVPINKTILVAVLLAYN